jgi:hypothetical protein
VELAEVRNAAIVAGVNRLFQAARTLDEFPNILTGAIGKVNHRRVSDEPRRSRFVSAQNGAEKRLNTRFESMVALVANTNIAGRVVLVTQNGC